MNSAIAAPGCSTPKVTTPEGFSFFDNSIATITKVAGLQIDSTNMIYGAYEDTDGVGIFKYDPTSDVMSWAKHYTGFTVKVPLRLSPDGLKLSISLTNSSGFT